VAGDVRHSVDRDIRVHDPDQIGRAFAGGKHEEKQG
jgi:hypothetical protein